MLLLSVFMYLQPDFRDSLTDASVKAQNENSPDQWGCFMLNTIRLQQEHRAVLAVVTVGSRLTSPHQRLLPPNPAH